MKKSLALISLLIVSAFLCWSAPSPSTGTVTLTWTYNFQANPGVTNFMVYYGTTTSNYTSSMLSGGTNTTATVSGLARGNTYFFNVTPLSGPEGDYTTETSAAILPKSGKADNLTVVITIQ